MPRLAMVSLLVHDYAESISFFVDRVGFVLEEDHDLGGCKRWVRIRPPGSAGGASLLLARASTSEQKAAVGCQAGGRVGFFLETDDFNRDYARMARAGVEFHEAPRQEVYGKVAVWSDLYGNRWDLLEPQSQ